MKLIKLDPNNLPEREVLAYNGIDNPVIGRLDLIEENVVFCVYGASDENYIPNVTHYIPLTEINPESDRPRSYFMFAALRYFGSASNTGFSTMGCNFELLSNENLKGIIDDWLLGIRKAVAQDHYVQYDNVIITSFSCTETT